MGRVVVLEPSALLTVTVEQREGDEVHLHAGGQGCWISRMLAVLDVPVTLVVSLGGETGAVLSSLVRRDGVEVCEVPVEARNGCYVDDRRGGSRNRLAQTAPPALSRHDVDDLCSAVRAHGLGADAVVLGGPSDGDVLASDVYRVLAADLTAGGTKVVVDLTGPLLDSALEGGVFLAKVSDEELRESGRLDGDDEDALVRAMQELRRAGAEHVVVTRAGEPALALFDGTVLVARAPRVQPVDHTGPGDSLTAGVVAGVVRGEELTSALRLGMAAGALNVARHGLGSGRRPDIERFAQQVDVAPLGADATERGAVTPAELASWVRVP